MTAPRLHVRAARLFERPVAMRIPFRFGDTEVTETAEIYCVIDAEMAGQGVRGFSAQLMVPRWFDKRPALSNASTVGGLRSAARAAADAVVGMAGTVAGIAAEVRAETPGRLTEGTPPLAAGFGPALIEMALIDAACRGAHAPFWRAAREDLFGLVAHRPADLPAEALSATLAAIGPPDRIALRHTLGAGAPLTAAEAEAGGTDASDAAQAIAGRTGIRAWKVKLTGDPDADLVRLADVTTALSTQMDGGVTLDANEQYAPDAFADFADRLRSDPATEPLRRTLRFVEQPFARDVALATRADAFGLPLVIDESDDAEDAFARALSMGWAGTSIKSCKGVLRAILNAARARAASAILSGEDLTCQPGLCWQQDTAMASACGVGDVERNGHHFAGGMQGAPGAERHALLAAHADIYDGPPERPTLRIKDGGVAIASLDRPGFGGSEAVVPPEI